MILSEVRISSKQRVSSEKSWSMLWRPLPFRGLTKLTVAGNTNFEPVALQRGVRENWSAGRPDSDVSRTDRASQVENPPMVSCSPASRCRSRRRKEPSSAFCTGMGPGTRRSAGRTPRRRSRASGTVRVRSRLREGTTVQVYLPRAMKAVSTGSARRSDDRVIGGAHVLVVADDPDVRSSVTSHVLHQFPEAG